MFKYMCNLSVSTGTLRAPDLATAFAPLVEDIHNRDNHIDAWALHNKLTYIGLKDIDDELAHETVTRAVDLINSYAPEGYYFGPHQGDGADYGFWEIEQ